MKLIVYRRLNLVSVYIFFGKAAITIQISDLEMHVAELDLKKFFSKMIRALLCSTLKQLIFVLKEKIAERKRTALEIPRIRFVREVREVYGHPM